MSSTYSCRCTATWHPGAVAWGIVGLYLLGAVQVTSLLRTRLPKRLWRATHVASFPLFFVATLHAITAGSDMSNVVVRTAAMAGAAAVAGLTAWRIAQLDAAAA